jgi:hypothetical protein
VIERKYSVNEASVLGSQLTLEAFKSGVLITVFLRMRQRAC